MSRHLAAFLVAAVAVSNSTADAQPLGTFRWQLQPYCNVVTVAVTQPAGVYLVDGFDDQCGAPQRAPLVGLATPNPDGTIGFGLHVVTTPGADRCRWTRASRSPDSAVAGVTVSATRHVRLHPWRRLWRDTPTAAGGATFYSDSGMTTGVVLAVNGTQWSSLSDVNSKHAFRDLDGEDVLTRIARMPVREWSYKAQEVSIRHIGPTAQDFRAAFGLGEDPLRIGTLDAEGVALAAVRALEARTRAMREENEALRAALAELRRELDALSRR